MVITPEKTTFGQRPVPHAWRPVFTEIVARWVVGDFSLDGVGMVARYRSEDLPRYIQGNVEAYGEALAPLPEASWETSVCHWDGLGWRLLIDLWTAPSGRSDLVNGASVFDVDGVHELEIGLVYVP